MAVAFSLLDDLSEILFLIWMLFNILTEDISLLSDLPDFLIQVIFLCCEVLVLVSYCVDLRAES